MITSLRQCQLSHQAFHKQLNSAIADFNTYIWKAKQPASAADVAVFMEQLKEKAEEIHHLRNTVDFYAHKIQKFEENQRNEECNKS